LTQGFIYTVKPGDWISKIASTYGFADWRRVWNAPENEDLRKLRPDPNVIHPGDRVFVPVIEPQEFDRGTDNNHRFILKSHRKRLKIKFETVTGVARANVPCRVEIDRKLRPEITQTNPDGMIDIEISDRAETGSVVLGEGLNEYYVLKLGHLDPIETIRGYQERLQNLGHYAGQIDGFMGPRTNAAIRLFQSRENLLGYRPPLKVDGIMGPKTMRALRRRHGY
jgi:N-acetylmuramoyl-L-alanine amidase